jgi:hypothetical protein
MPARPFRNVERLCALAARLHEDAVALRNLGLHETASLLEKAELDVDHWVYARVDVPAKKLN